MKYFFVSLSPNTIINNLNPFLYDKISTFYIIQPADAAEYEHLCRQRGI